MNSQILDSPDDDVSPDHNSYLVMRAIDQMSKQWRALVHEYGFQLTCAMREGGLSIRQANDQLRLLRAMRQAEWLSTNYVTKKTAHNYFP